MATSKRKTTAAIFVVTYMQEQEIQRWFELDTVQRNPVNSGSIAWVDNCHTRKVSTASVLVFW